MSKKNKHIHKLIKVNGKHIKLFKCAFPDCSYYLNQGQFELLLGKYSICNNCGSKFIMNEDSLNEDLPNCVECKLKAIISNNVSNSLTKQLAEEITITDMLDGYLDIKGI